MGASPGSGANCNRRHKRSLQAGALAGAPPPPDPFCSWAQRPSRAGRGAGEGFREQRLQNLVPKDKERRQVREAKAARKNSKDLEGKLTGPSRLCVLEPRVGNRINGEDFDLISWRKPANEADRKMAIVVTPPKSLFFLKFPQRGGRLF